MEIEQPKPPAEPEFVLDATDLRTRWGRLIAIAAAVVFVISSAFPLAAGLSHDTESFPKWWGALDVGIAFFLALLVFVIFGLAQGKANKQADDITYRAYRILIHGIFVLLVLFFLLGDRIVWPNCLTGFAWRYWLLLYGLPAWLTVVRHQVSPSSPVAQMKSTTS
jgi:hypothetical protein